MKVLTNLQGESPSGGDLKRETMEIPEFRTSIIVVKIISTPARMHFDP